jgi:hypothetical protein
MLRKSLLMFAILLIATTLACSLLRSNGSEFTLAKTEIGKPTGPPTSKTIGPEGGSISSPDGRVTVKVPANVVTGNIEFGIQPITNQVPGGIGNGYRLEPDGQKFSAPVEVLFKYDDSDLEGTVPEAFALAFQDSQGEWQAQKSAKLDKIRKTLTVSSRHFSDWSFLSRMFVSPSKATLPVGMAMPLSALVSCEQGFFERLLNRPGTDCTHSRTPASKIWKWELQGAGTLTPSGRNVIYTAPAKKPVPSVVHVLFSYEFEQWDESRIDKVEGTLASEITIVGNGYTASGSDGGIVYSGIVCSLDAPFSITGTHPLIVHTFNFVPSSGTSGTMQYSTGGGGKTISGNGTYTISGIETKWPELVVNVASTARVPMASSSGSGVAHIHLTELDNNKCQ